MTWEWTDGLWGFVGALLGSLVSLVTSWIVHVREMDERAVAKKNLQELTGRLLGRFSDEIDGALESDRPLDVFDNLRSVESRLQELAPLIFASESFGHIEWYTTTRAMLDVSLRGFEGKFEPQNHPRVEFARLDEFKGVFRKGWSKLEPCGAREDKPRWRFL